LYCIKVAKAMSAFPFALWTAPAGSEKWWFLGFAFCAAVILVFCLWRRRRGERLTFFEKTGII
ncbi:MAG: hypothetical protein IKR49_10290, partial [Clostridia bacterium]|nr:hypothetical protein [Clostridia bacterium]